MYENIWFIGLIFILIMFILQKGYSIMANSLETLNGFAAQFTQTADAISGKLTDLNAKITELDAKLADTTNIVTPEQIQSALQPVADKLNSIVNN